MTTIEMLISTMDCDDYVDLYKKMNIKTDAIIINQGSETYYSESEIDGNRIRFFSFKEKGVGLSRNNALMRSTADICIMSDDDMVYVDNYEEIVKLGYEKYRNADMIVFNAKIRKNNKEKDSVLTERRIGFHNCLSFGTVNFTFKRSSIVRNNIYFSLLFGGGSLYSSGEDSLFIWNILREKLSVYSVPKEIATVYNDNSSWFEGYNEKFFFDKGALFKALMPRLYFFMILQFLLRHTELCKGIGIKRTCKLMLEGAKNFKLGEL